MGMSTTTTDVTRSGTLVVILSRPRRSSFFHVVLRTMLTGNLEKKSQNSQNTLPACATIPPITSIAASTGTDAVVGQLYYSVFHKSQSLSRLWVKLAIKTGPAQPGHACSYMKHAVTVPATARGPATRLWSGRYLPVPSTDALDGTRFSGIGEPISGGFGCTEKSKASFVRGAITFLTVGSIATLGAVAVTAYTFRRRVPEGFLLWFGLSSILYGAVLVVGRSAFRFTFGHRQNIGLSAERIMSLSTIIRRLILAEELYGPSGHQ
jgi:hypothetical protein